MLIMGSVCYYLNEDFLSDIRSISMMTKVCWLLLIISSCKIIYLGLIFVLKVLTIQDLKGYIRK